MKHILLLHGAIGAKDQLIPLSEKLKDHFTVHTLNFSGHGGEKMPDKFSIELFAKDVLNYLEKNKIERINIFGYSMGGYVALYLAKYYPEKVGKIFTLATKFSWTPEIAQKEIRMLNAEKIAEKIPAFAKALEQRHQPNDPSTGSGQRWKEILGKTAAMMIALGDENALSLSDLENIQQEAIIGIGDKDSMVTMDETKDMVKALPNGKLMIFENTEHPIEKVNMEHLSKELKLNF